MPYVEYDSSNNIVGAYANAQPGRAETFLPDDDPGVVAFLASLVPPFTCQLWQLQAVMTPEQWAAAQKAIAVL